MPFRPHFGLESYPFQLIPNPEYYFPGAEHQRILQALQFALGRQAGILKVTGDIGTGKTLLCHLLLRRIGERDDVAYLHAPHDDEALVVRTVCREFGLEPGEGDNPYEMLRAFLVERHAEGRLAVLVIDEAQALGRGGLEAVRLLSTLETETHKLLQIVLFGQTELDEMLRADGLRQLNQRIVFSFRTQPLSRAETRRYIEFRLDRARAEGVSFRIFTRGALRRLAAASGGIPRVANVLADKALLAAFAEGARTVTGRHVGKAVADSRTLLATRPGRRPAWVMAAAAGAAAVVVLALLAMGAGGLPAVGDTAGAFREQVQRHLGGAAEAGR